LQQHHPLLAVPPVALAAPTVILCSSDGDCSSSETLLQLQLYSLQLWRDAVAAPARRHCSSGERALQLRRGSFTAPKSVATLVRENCSSDGTYLQLRRNTFAAPRRWMQGLLPMAALRLAGGSRAPRRCQHHAGSLGPASHPPLMPCGSRIHWRPWRPSTTTWCTWEVEEAMEKVPDF
jgi:hypothetical protein